MRVSWVGIPLGMASAGPCLSSALVLWLAGTGCIAGRDRAPSLARPRRPRSCRMAAQRMARDRGVACDPLCAPRSRVWWRPLFPWDAWTQWGTGAHLVRAPTSCRSSASRMAEPIGAGAYHDAAPHYPATVPLFQVWSALLIGRWDDALVSLPWWVSGVAFAIALYGALLRLSFAPLIAWIGSAMVVTMPIVNVHIALAGYADLPMAMYLAGDADGVACDCNPQPRRCGARARAPDGLRPGENPGKAWMLVLLPAFVVAAMPRRGLKIAGVAFAGAALRSSCSHEAACVSGYQLSRSSRCPGARCSMPTSRSRTGTCSGIAP